MKKRKINLQKFAAPEGLTASANIQVRAREIDFVTSFSKNLQSLMDVLGITRPIKKENGSVLKTKKATGTLKDGKVAEGEEIPYSQFDVVEEVFDKIQVEKYRKGISIEAIADKGYDAAVEMTDEEMKTLLQNIIENRLYDQLKKGSLVSHENTFQKALAMAIGRVKAKFQDMGRTATGIAAFVNTLDVYEYLGSAAITVQTAFGMDYIENFLGADIVFLSTKIPAKTVIATPVNNLVVYYVDPADSEFARAGLSYTTDPETGYVGVHAEGNYGRALSELFAFMGIRIFAEYMDAIANIAIGEADTQTLNTLTVKSEAGVIPGTTHLTVDPGLMSINNVLKYKEAASATDVTYGMDVKGWTRWDGKSDIVATNGNHITVVECDQNYKAIASGDVVAVVTPVSEESA